MPRVLPKLVRRIKSSKIQDNPNFSRNHIIAFRHTRRATPGTLSPLGFSPHGRTRSILLDEWNPIINRDAYVRHKADEPILLSAADRGKHTNTNRHIEEMTDHECRWWSDPYSLLSDDVLSLRNICLSVRSIHMDFDEYMKSSHISDFLIRLAVLQVGDTRFSQPMLALLPDGVEHPRFRRRNSGRGYYLTAHKMFIDEMSSRSSHKRIPVSMLRVHSLLAAQIGYQLRLRVLQELELMAESLRCTPQGSPENTVIRRLTRTEWSKFKNSGLIPQPGAVALIVVPPLDKRNYGDLRQSSDEKPSRSRPELPPLSVLHGTQVTRDDISPISLISPSQVPLYNGLALFPSRAMRSELYGALQKALFVERRARWREVLASRSDGHITKSKRKKSTKEKASHAYLLRSDENTVRRADSVPLAIALWRVRMWEGQGWDTDMGYGNWETNPNL